MSAAPPRARSSGRTALGPLAALLFVACAHRAGPAAPADPLVAFSAAVERRDFGTAYGYMSSGYRKRVSLAEFQASLEAAGEELPAMARRLRDSARTAPPRAEVTLDLGEKVPLIWEQGAWRVDAPPLEAYSQKTPRAALRTFLRAMERGRYDIALRLVPAPYRDGVTAEKLRREWEGDRREANRNLIQRLRAAVDAPIVERGDEAHMPYGAGAEVRFVREDGAWKIEDLE